MDDLGLNDRVAAFGVSILGIVGAFDFESHLGDECGDCGDRCDHGGQPVLRLRQWRRLPSWGRK